MSCIPQPSFFFFLFWDSLAKLFSWVSTFQSSCLRLLLVILKSKSSWAWYHMPVISTLERLTQNCEVKASMTYTDFKALYTEKSCCKNKPINQPNSQKTKQKKVLKKEYLKKSIISRFLSRQKIWLLSILGILNVNIHMHAQKQQWY